MPTRTAPQRRSHRPAPGLADRLVETTEALLAEQGVEGLSLRAIARGAGVTHGAPLRHYRSFGALLAEVAARGFRRLFAAVERAEASVPPGGGARARLVACAQAYVRQAVAEPGVFALMFRPELLDVASEAFTRDSHAAFDQLLRSVRAAQDAGWRTGTDSRRLAGALWASVHGLASLWSQGAYQGVVRATSLDEALDTLVGLVLADAPVAPLVSDPAAPQVPSPFDRRRTP